MDADEAIAYLTQDGDLSVPCSRWGRRSGECAEVAYDLAVILSDATGEPMTRDTLDYAMGLVVNDHDDVAYMFREYRAADLGEEMDWVNAYRAERDDVV